MCCRAKKEHAAPSPSVVLRSATQQKFPSGFLHPANLARSPLDYVLPFKRRKKIVLRGKTPIEIIRRNTAIIPALQAAGFIGVSALEALPQVELFQPFRLVSKSKSLHNLLLIEVYRSSGAKENFN